jgi:hypothetical protein
MFNINISLFIKTHDCLYLVYAVSYEKMLDIFYNTRSTNEICLLTCPWAKVSLGYILIPRGI